MRRAAKVDANQQEIVDALRDVGAVVFSIGQPLDLLVALRGKLQLVEIKNPDGEDKVSTSQKETIERLKAVGVEVKVIRSIDEAIDCLYNG